MDRDVLAQRVDRRLERLAEAGAALVAAAGSAGRRGSPGLRGRSPARTMSTYSRVRARGFGYGWPYQPSTTCGPDAPSPSTIRPPERWSRVSALIAVAVGVRAAIWTMLVPSRIRLVERAVPGQRRERVRAVRLRRPHRVEAELLGPHYGLQRARGRPAAPVPDVESQLHECLLDVRRVVLRLAALGQRRQVPGWSLDHRRVRSHLAAHAAPAGARPRVVTTVVRDELEHGVDQLPGPPVPPRVALGPAQAEQVADLAVVEAGRQPDEVAARSARSPAARARPAARAGTAVSRSRARSRTSRVALLSSRTSAHMCFQ